MSAQQANRPDNREVKTPAARVTVKAQECPDSVERSIDNLLRHPSL